MFNTHEGLGANKCALLDALRGLEIHTLEWAARLAEKPALTCEGYGGNLPPHLDPKDPNSHSDAHDYCHRSLEMRDSLIDEVSRLRQKYNAALNKQK